MVFGIDDVRGSNWKATALDPLAQGSADYRKGNPTRENLRMRYLLMRCGIETTNLLNLMDLMQITSQMEQQNQPTPAPEGRAL